MPATLNIPQDLHELVRAIKTVRRKKPVFIIGIAGGTGCGKTFLADMLTHFTGGKMLSLDDYYLDIAEVCDGNFDEPAALDLRLLHEHLAKLAQGQTIQKPCYDFATNARVGCVRFSPYSPLIVEGMFALNEQFAKMIDFHLYVEAPYELRVARRVRRDVHTRGRPVEQILNEFKNRVIPMHTLHVEPQRSSARIILHNNTDWDFAEQASLFPDGRRVPVALNVRPAATEPAHLYSPLP